MHIFSALYFTLHMKYEALPSEARTLTKTTTKMPKNCGWACFPRFSQFKKGNASASTGQVYSVWFTRFDTVPAGSGIIQVILRG